MSITRPLTADELLAALALWGIKPRFYRQDWRAHNRNGVGPWGPTINGFLVHNFASDISDTSSLAYLDRGEPLPPPKGRSLPGPLSQLALDDAGAVWVMGWGRCNHGGKGDAAFVRAMTNDALPFDRDFKPATNGTVDLNARTYGVEMLYGKAPTAAQRRALPVLIAALMHAHGYTAGSVGGHRESTTRRSDPVGFQMGPLRREVDALLKAGPPKKGTPTMTISNADADLIAQRVLEAPLIFNTGTGKRRSLADFVEGINRSTFPFVGDPKAGTLSAQGVSAQVSELTNHVAALTKLVQTLAAKP